MNADQLGSLQPALAALLGQFRPYFKREPTFKHMQSYIAGLMADLKRKSIEPIALAAEVPVRTLDSFVRTPNRWKNRPGRYRQRA